MLELPVWALSLIVAIASGMISGAVAWGGIHVELRWLRADVERLRVEIDSSRQSAARAHIRMDRHLEVTHHGKAET